MKFHFKLGLLLQIAELSSHCVKNALHQRADFFSGINLNKKALQIRLKSKNLLNNNNIYLHSVEHFDTDLFCSALKLASNGKFYFIGISLYSTKNSLQIQNFRFSTAPQNIGFIKYNRVCYILLKTKISTITLTNTLLDQADTIQTFCLHLVVI